MACSDEYRESPDGRYVLLPSGFALPIAPILLTLELQERGFVVRREGDDTLSVQPHQQLTEADRVRIRQWKFHILALLSHEAQEAVQ
jgi:hypothetical protein